MAQYGSTGTSNGLTRSTAGAMIVLKLWATCVVLNSALAQPTKQHTPTIHEEEKSAQGRVCAPRVWCIQRQFYGVFCSGNKPSFIFCQLNWIEMKRKFFEKKILTEMNFHVSIMFVGFVVSISVINFTALSLTKKSHSIAAWLFGCLFFLCLAPSFFHFPNGIVTSSEGSGEPLATPHPTAHWDCPYLIVNVMDMRHHCVCGEVDRDRTCLSLFDGGIGGVVEFFPPHLSPFLLLTLQTFLIFFF